MESNNAKSIDEYIAACPKGVQEKLKQMRAAVHAAAPQAIEKISYRMPTFYLEGNLVHFAALKNHIGFYPTPSGVQAFIKETANYASTKGAIQFPLDEPLPLKLVSKIVEFRVKENLERAKFKSRKRK
ncbi:MAG TPA: DUF1801 domain-containing protein [Anaerolineales bacterium]|nr:DUF1801 domain-containing protein [Anaerolineales bacterium]